VPIVLPDGTVTSRAYSLIEAMSPLNIENFLEQR
jgi:hypothetical protein